MNQAKTYKTVAMVLLAAFSLHSANARTIFRNDSTSVAQNEIIFDCSLFPASEAGYGYSWSPTIALRAGISRILVPRINVEGYIEYYQFRLPNGEGNSYFRPPDTKRKDFASYVGLSYARFFLIGAGVYYTTSQPVTWSDLLIPGGPQPWNYSGFSEFRFFWTIGVNGDIHIVNRIYMPIGMYYRNGYQGGLTFFRIGGAIRF